MIYHAMMTPSNGNIFRVTGHFCGEFTGHQWRGALMISLIFAWINGWVNYGEAGDLRCHGTHYDVTVMAAKCHNSPTWEIVLYRKKREEHTICNKHSLSQGRAHKSTQYENLITLTNMRCMVFNLWPPCRLVVTFLSVSNIWTHHDVAASLFFSIK